LPPQECLGEHNRNWVKCQKGKTWLELPLPALLANSTGSGRSCPFLRACCAEVQALKECHAKQQQLQAAAAAAKGGS
jgi:hypothetical protein